MPETAVDENNFFTNREDQVRRAWEIDRVESVAVPESMYKTPDGDLRLGIFRAHPCHVQRTSTGVEVIGHFDPMTPVRRWLVMRRPTVPVSGGCRHVFRSASYGQPLAVSLPIA